MGKLVVVSAHGDAVETPEAKAGGMTTGPFCPSML